MTRRIIAAALGGLIGLAIWLAVASYTGFTTVAIDSMYDENSLPDPLAERRRKKKIIYFVAAMIGCMIGGGAAVLFVGEKLRIVPTHEGVNEQTKPPSIFSNSDAPKDR